VIPLSEYHRGEILTQESLPLSELYQGEILTKESLPLSEYHQGKTIFSQSRLSVNEITHGSISTHHNRTCGMLEL